MKKITLMLGALLVSFAGFSQSMVGNGESDPVIYVQSNPELDPCTQSVATNGLENGGLFGGATNQSLAIDIDVDPDTTFSIEEIVPTYVGEATTADFIFRADDGGLPGDEIETVSAYVVTDDVITGNNFGFDFHQVTYLLDVPFELEGGADGTKYWMQIVTDADGWESSTASNTGLLGAFMNDNTAGEWSIGTSDYVYDLNGDCVTLGVGSNELSQVSIFPNPASDVLKIQTPASVELKSAAIYDVLGKRSNVSLANGQINVSNLAKGVYILSLETSAGTLTEKIVKK